MLKKQKLTKIDDKSIKEIFYKISLQQHFCKQIEEQLIKLTKYAFSPQLVKALSPNSTFITDHKNRLKLAKGLILNFNVKSKKQFKKNRIKPFGLRKNNKSHQQDLNIIPISIKIFSAANQNMAKLISLTNKIDNDILTSLFQQTLNENKDTINWLERILHNVTQPGLETP